MTTIQKVNTITSGLINYETIDKAAILAAVCGEHMLLIGDPGTGKSLFARKIFGHFAGDLYAVQCTQFDDESIFFGYPDMKSIKDEGIIRYHRKGLAVSEWFNPDEVMDLNDAALRSLLSILNERLFMRGGVEMKIPLRTCLGTSNFVVPPKRTWRCVIGSCSPQSPRSLATTRSGGCCTPTRTKR